MSLLFGIFVVATGLLALDLWTQPKPAPAPPVSLKE
jgi:hypothetical protein